MMRLIFLVILSLIFLQVRCQTQSGNNAEAAISSAVNTYLQKNEEVADCLKAQLVSVNALQAGIDKLSLSYGEDLFSDRFYKSIAMLLDSFYTIFTATKNSFVTINQIGLLQMRSYGSTFLKQCIASNLASNVTEVVSSAALKTKAANNQLSAFRNAVISMCRSPVVARVGKTDACLASAMKENPLPQEDDVGLQVVLLLVKLYNCLQFASDKIENVATAVLMNMKSLAPDQLQYLLPEKLADDNTPALVFPPTTTFALALAVVEKLNATKAFIQATKDVVKEATTLKDLSLLSAASSLQSQLKNLRDFVKESEKLATPQEIQCYANAKLLLLNSPKTNAANLLQCIASAGSLPTEFQFSVLEKSIRDRELKEKALTPVVECSVQPQNAFDPEALRKCFKLAQEDYLSFLEGIRLQADLLRANADSVLNSAKRCVCQAKAQLAKAANNELYTLSDCITKLTKVRLEVPQQECIINTCA